MSDPLDVVAAQFAGDTEIVKSQMFGKRCLKVATKAFVALTPEGDLVFKLSGVQHATACAIPGATLWDPSGNGRPMKEWVRIPLEHSRLWRRYASAACEYVRSGSGVKRK